MCEIRSTLKRAMDEIDALPEINSSLYDDTVRDAYNALETAYYMHEHYCDEAELIPTDSPQSPRPPI